MDFAVGQSIWLLTGYAPTLVWEQGVVVHISSGSFRPDTYSVALPDMTIYTRINPWSERLNMFILRPFFVTLPAKPAYDELVEKWVTYNA